MSALAIDLNPISIITDAAADVLADLWTAAMLAIWAAALWVLRTAFQIIDYFTTPDLSSAGPLGLILPTTLWIGAALAGVMMMVQLVIALVRRNGESFARIFYGVLQFGAVWFAFEGVAVGLVMMAKVLTQGILTQMLGIDVYASFDADFLTIDDLQDAVMATLLAVLSVMLLIPASFFYLILMLFREALLVLVYAVSPIAAGGLLSEVGRSWFWKTLRWFMSAILIAPAAALILGIGVKLSEGSVNPPTPPANLLDLETLDLEDYQDQPEAVTEALAYQVEVQQADIGMAIVGVVVMAIGCVCPLVLFRLLAFVDPNTASGASLRQSWSDAGGMRGITGRSGGSGSSAASEQSGGRAAGEGGADSAAAGRLSRALGVAGAGMSAAVGLAHRAADMGSDVANQAGIGSSGYAVNEPRQNHPRGSVAGDSSGGGQGVDPGGEGDPGGGGESVPHEPSPPDPVSPVGRGNAAPQRPPAPAADPATGGSPVPPVVGPPASAATSGISASPAGPVPGPGPRGDAAAAAPREQVKTVVQVKS